MDSTDWLDFVLWVLNNCVIAPYFDVELVDWEQLLTSLGIMLGISGVRDIGMSRRKKDDGNSKEI